MIASAANFRSLLSSGGVYVIGNSLLGIMLPLRMETEGFPIFLIGIVMTAYYVGQAIGSHFSKNVIFRVGHIRAFTIFAAVGAATTLIYDPFFSAPAWFALRIVNGFCFAGMATTMESWLNDHSSQESRGKVLGLYMTVQYLSVATGQLLVNLTDVNQPDLFMLAAGLISLSLIPVALTQLPEPHLGKYHPFGIGALFRKSPIGASGAATAGILLGTFYVMGVVYAYEIGLSVTDVSIFMGLAILGGFIIQWPVGKLSDYFDRRLVLIGVTMLPLVTWGVQFAFNFNAETPSALFVIALMLGASIASIYPLSVAQTFDRLERRDYVSASGGLVLSYAVGAIVGPLIATATMSMFGPQSFLGFEAVVATIFSGIVAYNMFKRPRPTPVQREPFVPVPTPSQAAIETD
ncbi:MFS transporter [Hyphococcus sp.]|uniref:MFS transporter n=1 Tax=Hyphococcus sp. TaxID=2038636 RepID=UPI003752F598